MSELAKSSERDLAEPGLEPHYAQGLPGPIERILQDLGVTNPAMLTRASAIDQLAEQLILAAADTIESGQAGPETVGLSTFTGSAELINHMLASGRPETAVILRPPIPSAPHSATPDAERSKAGHRSISRQVCKQLEVEAES
jgi:hypothetical protein